MGTIIILAVVVSCCAVSILLGLAASWNRQHISEDYFLAGRSLPWYIVALSVAGTGIRLEAWLGMIGLTYAVGMAAASLAWGNFIAISAIVWLFLPYFIRKKLFSPAEFLERRYSPATRGAFAILAIVALIVGVLAPALYLGGWALSEAGFGVSLAAVSGIPWALLLSILAIALFTGIYSIYGGTSAGAWSGAIQLLVVIAGGTLLAFVASRDAGGLSTLMEKNSGARAILLPPLSPQNPILPWTGLIAFWFTLAIWNSAASPAIVQRCLGARSEWDAKMGMLAAGILQILLAAIIVVPGFAALVKFGPATNTGLGSETAALRLIETLFGREGVLGPLGQGLIVAAVLASVMSAAAGVLTSVSTLWTMDICQDLLHRGASEAELVRRGRTSSAVTLILGTLAAPALMMWDKGPLDFILEAAAVIGPPVAVLFVVAFLWPRAHGRPAVVSLVLGVLVGILLAVVAANSETIPTWFIPVLNRAGITGLASLILLGLGTFIIPQNANELYDPDTKWSLQWSRLPGYERESAAGPRSLVFWWAVLLVLALAAWIVFR